AKLRQPRQAYTDSCNDKLENNVEKPAAYHELQESIHPRCGNPSSGRGSGGHSDRQKQACASLVSFTLVQFPHSTHSPLVHLLPFHPSGAVCDGASPPLGPGDMPVQEMAVSPVKSLYWELFPPMSQRRVYCTPVYHEGLVYVMGGCSETGMPLDSVEVLDVESQTWSQLPPLPMPRAGASAVALGGQVLVIGGMNQQQTPLASVEMYHPDEGKWETKASLPQPSMGVTTLEKG
ncbi:Kelch domain-containing protein 8B, partial [Nibea albiflora]